MKKRQDSICFFQRSDKTKFKATAKAIKWLLNRPGVEDTNVKMARKFLEVANTTKSDDDESSQLLIKQAKRKYP